MDTFGRAKLALRKYIKENKEKVKTDLETLTKKSTGKYTIGDWMKDLDML